MFFGDKMSNTMNPVQSSRLFSKCSILMFLFLIQERGSVTPKEFAEAAKITENDATKTLVDLWHLGIVELHFDYRLTNGINSLLDIIKKSKL